MAKHCSFCEFASDDVAAFGEHMRDVHHWDHLASARPPRTTGRVVMFALTGGVLAVVALYLLVWNMEQSCLRSGVASATSCGWNWYLFLGGVLPVAAIGIGVGAVLSHRFARAKVNEEAVGTDDVNTGSD